jgi:tetratricopeptide (TPR) repeat protein
MADKPKPKSESPAAVPQGAVAKPAEPPKPVHIGGESFVDRILPHLKKIIVGMLAAGVVLTVIFVIKWFRERQQVSETEKLDRVLEVAQAPIRAKDEKPDPKKPSYGSAKERAEAVLAAMAKNDTDIGGHAFRAGLLLDAGKVDEAIAEYKRGTADRTIEGVLCREGLGIALETKASAEKDPAARQKALEEALAAFAAMQPEDTGQRRSYALYHQARIQLLLGKRADAKALFEKAKEINKGADREIADLIEKRLATLGAS